MLYLLIAAAVWYFVMACVMSGRHTETSLNNRTACHVYVVGAILYGAFT